MSQDKAPVVLTLLFGAVGWTATRTIEQVSAVPFIEYRMSDESTEGMRRIEVRLRNVTFTREFSCVKLIVSPARKAPFKFDAENYDVILSSAQVPAVNPMPSERQMAFEIDKFGPKADIVLVMPGQGDGRVRIFSTDCAAAVAGSAANAGNGKSASAAKVKPLLIERSLRTFLVEWELQILWALIFLWAALVLPFSAPRTDSKARLTLRRPVTLIKRRVK